MVRIAIIDTGIKGEYIEKYLQNREIKCYEIKESYKYYDFSPCKPIDYNGHGTACASTINRICKDIDYIIVRLLNKEGKSNVWKMIAALSFMQYIDVDIINMSLSSDNQDARDKMIDVLSKLKSQGKYVFAAKSNNRQISLPASLKNVYGVQHYQKECGQLFNYKKDREIQITCDGTPIPIPFQDGNPLFSGNSKASAHMTGIAAKLLLENPTKSLDDLLNSFSVDLFERRSVSYEQTDNSKLINDFSEILRYHGLLSMFSDSKYAISFSEICKLITISSEFFNTNIDIENLSYSDLTSIDVFVNKYKKMENNNGLI